MEDTAKNEILTELRAFRKSVDARFDSVDAQFNSIDARFDGIDGELVGINARLDEVGRTVYETRDLVEDLIAARDDHEVRISTLERSNTRLRLLIDR